MPEMTNIASTRVKVIRTVLIARAMAWTRFAQQRHVDLLSPETHRVHG